MIKRNDTKGLIKSKGNLKTRAQITKATELMGDSRPWLIKP